jgi:ABC-2 type transport system ATP-binding protein
VKVESERPRDLARALLETEGVLGVDLQPGGLVVRAKNPNKFFPALNKILADGNYDVQNLEPLDDSAHAILGYLLGGSGKT